MTRNVRHQKIIEIIESKSIETQDDLASELINSGFAVTQATVSRDIKDLGLLKINDRGRQRYIKPNISVSVNKITDILRSSVKSIESAEDYVVLKVLAGCGRAAKNAIELLCNCMGSIADDDTVLIIFQSAIQKDAFMKKFHDIID